MASTVTTVGSARANRPRVAGACESDPADGLLRSPVMKIVVVVGLIAIVAALFSALVFLYRDRGHGTRMVKALAIRVGLSILLVTFLLVSYFMGWIGPQGLR
jgi:Protein of unknown function (DUF2909)